MQTLKPKKIIEKITNKRTGEVYENEEAWKSKDVPEEDIQRDITVIMPSLDYLVKPSKLRVSGYYACHIINNI